MELRIARRIVPGRLLAAVVCFAAAGARADAVQKAPDDPAAKELKAKVTAFEKRFRDATKKPDWKGEREAALADLAGLDAPIVAKALLAAEALALQDDMAALKEFQEASNRDAKLIDEIAKQIGKKGGPTPEQKAKLDKYQAQMDAAVKEQKAHIDVAMKAERQIVAMASSETVDWLLDDLIGNPQASVDLKLAIARHAADRVEPMTASLTRALQRAKLPADFTALLKAIAEFPVPLRDGVPTMISVLGREEPELRAQAAAALAAIGAREAVAPLVAHLGQEKGATKRRFAIALERLTGQKFRADAEAWTKWLDEQGTRIASGEIALPPVDRRPAVDLLGAPLEGHSFVFVLDCSEWMLVDASSPKWDKPLAQMSGPSRLELVKKAVKDALGALKPDDSFNVVAYADEPRRFSKTLVDATPEKLTAAQAWVDALTTAKGTIPNLHDGLVAGLYLSTASAAARGGAADSLVLVTASRPQIRDPDKSAEQNPQPDSAERILTNVGKLNSDPVTIVNVVALGTETDDKLLQALTKAFGGVLVRR